MARLREVICFQAALWNCQPNPNTTMVVRTAWITSDQVSSGPSIDSSITGALSRAAPITLRFWIRNFRGIALVEGSFFVSGHRSDLVADSVDGRGECGHVDGARVDDRSCLLAGEVDHGGLDAFLLAEDALDPDRARGTGHAFDIKSDRVCVGHCLPFSPLSGLSRWSATLGVLFVSSPFGGGGSRPWEADGGGYQACRRQRNSRSPRLRQYSPQRGEKSRPHASTAPSVAPSRNATP